MTKRRIDRPLVPERLPSGRTVSGKRGQADVGGEARAAAACRPDAVSGRLPDASRQRRHLVARAVATVDMATRAARGRTQCSRPLLPQVTATSK
jgi:hypothetical protein